MSTTVPFLAKLDVLEMVRAYSFGDSYGFNTNQGADQSTLWVNRIVARHRMQALSQFAVAGTRSDQILAAVQTSWPVNGRGVVFLSDCCINDSVQYGDTTGTGTTAEAFRSILAYLTAQYVSASLADTGVTFGPGWTAGVSDGTAGRHVDIGFVGDEMRVHLGYVTGAGATVTITDSAGTVRKTVTTGGFKQNFTGTVSVSGFGAGAHSVRVTATSGTATVQSYSVRSATPPLIVWLKAGQQSSNSAVWTRLQAYYAACQPIADGFAALVPFATVDMATDSGWDYTTMIGPDAIHPNDWGVLRMTNFAQKKIAAVIASGFKQGLNQLTGSTGATYTPSVAAYTSPSATAPGQVTGLSTATGVQIKLNWTVPADNGATITGYTLQYRVTSAGGAWTTYGGTIPGGLNASYTVPTGLTANTGYDFQLAAVSPAGTGTFSSTATGTTADPQTSILNAVTATALAGYSIRRLKATYTGPLFTVRRSSDNTTQDISAVAGGVEPDTAALASFVGSGSGYVSKLWDQTGGGKHLVQATTAAQPRIVNAGTLETQGGKLSMFFDGTAMHLPLGSALGLYAAGGATTLLVGKGAASATTGTAMSEASTSNTQPLYDVVASPGAAGALSQLVRNDTGTVLVNDAAATPLFFNNTLNQASVRDSATAWDKWVNGAVAGSSITYTRSGAMTPNNFALGVIPRATLSGYFSGYISELAIWGSALSTSDRQAGEGSQKAYFGTP
jgi:hypothetical protein